MSSSSAALDKLLQATDVYMSKLLEPAPFDDEENFSSSVREQPSLIVNCQMRKYQLEGLDWFAQLVRHGFNGILADEMGLGKTLQSISIMALVKERGWSHPQPPHLIVVPKTTIDNWLKEFARFAPTFRCVSLIGTAEERQAIIDSRLLKLDFDVLITSFDICRIEIASLRKISFGFFFLDEAHRIKNEESILSFVVRSLRAQRTFLLTGTPLQNNLHELWAILNFIMPSIFDSPADFDEIFAQISNSEETQVVAKVLHRILRPFMLRRLKTDVARDLPPKKELYVYVPLSPLQKQVYKDIVLKNADSVLNANNAVGKTRLVNTLMQLRKCCNHPYLFPGLEPGPPYFEGEHLVENSGKLVVLDKLVDRILSADSSNQILIFSQMTKLLDILDDYCRFRKVPHCRIDGSTTMADRVAQIDEFSQEGSEKKIFLLSTRAGGLGINLVSANFVIIFDSDFNPQSDLQAIDRAHRIGQKRPVTVYRFVTRNTVEEKIIEKAAQKLRIDKMVIQKESKEEIGQVLKFGVSDLFAANDKADETSAASSLDALLKFSEQKTAELTAELGKFNDDFALRIEAPLVLPEEIVLAAETAALVDQFVFEDIGPRERKPVLPPKRVMATPILKTRLAEWRAKVGGGHEYQFFQDKRLDVLEKKKNLSTKEKAEQARLLSEGFPNWSRRNFQTITKFLEEFGSGEDVIQKIIAALPERSPTDVKRYIDVLFRSGDQFLGKSFMSRFLGKVNKTEKLNAIVENQMEALDRMMQLNSGEDINVWSDLPMDKISSNRLEEWPIAADRVVLCALANFGYGNWSAIKQCLRVYPSLALNFTIHQQSKDQVKQRVDELLRRVASEFTKKKKTK